MGLLAFIYRSIHWWVQRPFECIPVSIGILTLSITDFHGIFLFLFFSNACLPIHCALSFIELLASQTKATPDEAFSKIFVWSFALFITSLDRSWITVLTNFGTTAASCMSILCTAKINHNKLYKKRSALVGKWKLCNYWSRPIGKTHEWENQCTCTQSVEAASRCHIFIGHWLAQNWFSVRFRYGARASKSITATYFMRTQYTHLHWSAC